MHFNKNKTKRNWKAVREQHERIRGSKFSGRAWARFRKFLQRGRRPLSRSQRAV